MADAVSVTCVPLSTVLIARCRNVRPGDGHAGRKRTRAWQVLDFRAVGGCVPGKWKRLRDEPDRDHLAGQGVLLDAEVRQVEAVNDVAGGELDHDLMVLVNVQLVHDMNVVGLREFAEGIISALRIAFVFEPFLVAFHARITHSPFELAGADGDLQRGGFAFGVLLAQCVLDVGPGIDLGDGDVDENRRRDQRPGDFDVVLAGQEPRERLDEARHFG